MNIKDNQALAVAIGVVGLLLATVLIVALVSASSDALEDDNIFLGSASDIAIQEPIPDCDNSTADKLQYDAATNDVTCDTTVLGGSAVVFDIGDDGGDDSLDVSEIATTGDTNTIFTESAADKILIAVGSNWPTSDTADALSANPTDCGADTKAETIAANGDLTCAAVDTGDITNDTILEIDLNALDAPADEECLTFEDTAADFEWQTCGGGGGDSVTVNSTAADTTANFLDGDIDFTLVDGGGGGPDDITATVACTDCVTLATETTGNFVATIADAGNSNITVVGSGSENAAITLDVVDVTCTDCLTATEITDIYLLNSGDATTGDIDYNDGATDSPKATFSPASGTAWDIFTDDTSDDLQIEVTSAVEEALDIVNTGAGTVRLVLDGGLTLSSFDCTGNANGGVLTADASGIVSCDDDDGGAGGGDNVTVNSTAADTTANFLDGDIDFTLVDGGGGGPDDVTATVACTGCVDTTDIEDDTITFADISDSSAIDADTTFTAGDGIDLTWTPTHTNGDTNFFTIDSNQTDDGDGTDDFDVFRIELVSESGDAGDTYEGLVIEQEAGTANTVIDAGIRITNLENLADTMAAAILISATTTDAITTAIDVSDAEIGIAINIGANTLDYSTGSLSAADLEILDDTTVTLTTETTGNYVLDVADGTGIDGTASGEGATYTPVLDLTEISSLTWGAGSFTTMTFNAGVTDPILRAATTLLSLEAADFLIDNGNELRLGEPDGAGSNYIAILAPATLAANRTCTLEDDSTPFDPCVSGAGGGDVTDVGDCSTGACFTGASGTTLTSNTDIIIDIDDDNNATESFQVRDGTDSIIFEVQEANNFTFGDGSSGNVNLSFDGDAGSDGFLVWNVTSDTFTSDLGLNITNTGGDSAALALTPDTGTAFSLYVENTGDDLQIEVNTASTETIDIVNAGAGVVDVNIDGTLTGTTAVAGPNVTSGANPGHTHTTTSISALDISDDTDLTAGRSLTLTDDEVLADVELYTETKGVWIGDADGDGDFDAADDLESWYRFDFAATIISIWCETDTGTANLDVQIDDGTPADINGSDIACVSGGIEDTSFAGDTTAGDGDRLDILIGSVASTPGRGSIMVTYTKDD